MIAARLPVYDPEAYRQQMKAEGMAYIQRGYEVLVTRARHCLPVLDLADLDKLEAALVRGIDSRDDVVAILRDLTLRGVIPPKHFTKPLQRSA